MGKPSNSSGRNSLATGSSASPTSRGKSLVVSRPLTPSRVAWLKQQSKRVAEVSSQRSVLEVSKSPSAGLKSVAGRVLSSPKASKSAKSAAAAVLTQRVSSRASGATLATPSKPHHVLALLPAGRANMANEKTSRKAASAAAKVLSNPKSTPAAKSAAGSALTQRGSTEVTGKAAASKAAKVLSSPTASKAAKSAAGSALTQRPSKGRR